MTCINFRLRSNVTKIKLFSSRIYVQVRQELSYHTASCHAITFLPLMLPLCRCVGIVDLDGAPAAPSASPGSGLGDDLSCWPLSTAGDGSEVFRLATRDDPIAALAADVETTGDEMMPQPYGF